MPDDLRAFEFRHDCRATFGFWGAFLMASLGLALPKAMLGAECRGNMGLGLRNLWEFMEREQCTSGWPLKETFLLLCMKHVTSLVLWWPLLFFFLYREGPGLGWVLLCCENGGSSDIAQSSCTLDSSLAPSIFPPGFSFILDIHNQETVCLSTDNQAVYLLNVMWMILYSVVY